MATSLWDRVDEHLSAFIHFGKMLQLEQRRQLARQLVMHLFDPQYEGAQNHKIADSSPIWQQLIQSIFNKEELRQLTAYNEDLALSIAQHILNWMHKTARSLEIGHAHTDELLKFRSWQDQASIHSQQSWRELVGELQEKYPDFSKNWDFYRLRLQTQDQQASSEALTESQAHSILHQKIIADWEQLLFRKKLQFETEYLEEAFGHYYDRLRSRVDKLNFLGDILEPYYRHLGALWNKAIPEWNKVPWDKIEEFVQTLRADKKLKELAEMLGRWQMVELEIEEEQREKILPRENWKPNPYGKSEIIGIHYSDNISGTLPMEFAMLSHPDTELIFSRRFVEKKLLSFQYRAHDMESDSSQEEETIKEPKIAEQGPVILVIDTSGSMFGKPEQIAKAIGFVVLSRALRRKRPCYLISFSDQIHTLELTRAGKELDLMIEFLTMSFHGGTDIQPALREALKMLKTERFEKADVLIMSDFMIPWVEEKVRNEIVLQRKTKGTQFHSLYITRSIDPGAVPLAIFDHHWLYDLDYPQVVRQTLEAFDSLENG